MGPPAGDLGRRAGLAVGAVHQSGSGLFGPLDAQLLPAQGDADRADHRRARARRDRDRRAGPQLRQVADRGRDPAGDEGCDDLGRGSPLLFAFRHRSGAHGRRDHRGADRIACARGRYLDHQPAAGAQRLPQQQPVARPQAARGDPRHGARVEVFEGADPRALSQQGLFRRRRLWHRFGQPQVLQPSRNRALGRRGGDHRRAGQGAQPLFAYCRCRCRGRPRQRGAAADEGTGAHFARRHRRSQRSAAEGRGRAELGALFHRLGAAAARHAAARNLRADRGVDHARRRNAACGDGLDQGEHARWGAGRAGQHGPRRRCARAGGRHRLRPDQLQPRHRCAAAAGFVMETVRLSRRARSGLHARRPRGRHGGDHRRLEPAQFERAQCRRNRPAHSLRLFDQHGRGAARQ